MFRENLPVINKFLESSLVDLIGLGRCVSEVILNKKKELLSRSIQLDIYRKSAKVIVAHDE